MVDKESRKLPSELTVIVGMCAFLDFFCMNQIMPNVPFMIADFFPDVHCFCVPLVVDRHK